MSRSGYTDECEGWDLIRWRGAVRSATCGKRGQTLLRDLLATLDAMPVKRLIAGELEQEGEVCALGALGVARGLNLSTIDPDDPEVVAKTFNIAPALAQEIVFENDEGAWGKESPENRWVRVRAWVAQQIKEETRPT